MKKIKGTLAVFMMALCMTFLLSIAGSAAGNIGYDGVQPGDTLVVATQHGVNFRKTDSIYGKLVTNSPVLPTGAMVTVKRKAYNQGWLQVIYGGVVGYVFTYDSDCGYFFTKYDPNAAKHYAMSGYQATSRVSGLNVRQNPNTNSAVLGSLSQGQVVDAIGNVSTGWIKISYTVGSRKITGYVKGSYVNVTKKKVETKKKANVNDRTSFSDYCGYYAKSKSSKKLKVYASANTNSAVVDKLDKARILYIEKKSKNGFWYQIYYNSHQGQKDVAQFEEAYMCTGYVLASDVKVYDVFKKLYLSQKKMTLTVGTSATLTVKDKYKIYSDAARLGVTVSYKSSKKSVAKVNAKTGEITAVKKGKATITATLKIGEGKSKRTRKLTCKVTVKK